MNDTVFQRLLQLNSTFYERVGSDFSATRQSAWDGWKRLLPIITNSRGAVLDLACGNGRFGDYLRRSRKDLQYIGLDTSRTLLEEARGKELDVKHCDVILKPAEISGMFDIVCAFGITHHIPSHDFRLKWFSLLSSRVARDGYFICTFWDFLHAESKKPVRSIKTAKISITERDIEDGDYFLGWDTLSGVWRYCHAYSDEEIDEIKSLFLQNNFSLVDEYLADGRNQRMNRYLVFRR